MVRKSTYCREENSLLGILFLWWMEEEWKAELYFLQMEWREANFPKSKTLWFTFQTLIAFLKAKIFCVIDSLISGKFKLIWEFLQILNGYYGYLREGFNRCPEIINFVIKNINPSFLNEAIFESSQDIQGKDVSQARREELRRLEEEYLQDYFDRSQIKIRVILIFGILAIVAFAPLDLFCLPSSVAYSWSIRVFLSLYFAVLFCLSLWDKLKFKKWYQILISIGLAITGLAIIFMIAIAKPTEIASYTYYGGLTLVLTFTFAFSSLRFLYALISANIVVVSYWIVSIVFQGVFSSSESGIFFISNSFFLISSDIVLACACYFSERSSRLEFLLRYTITNELLELCHYYEFSYLSRKEILDKINKLKTSPRLFRRFVLETIVNKESSDPKFRLPPES